MNNELAVGVGEVPTGNQGTREPVRVVLLGGYAMTRAGLRALLPRQPACTWSAKPTRAQRRWRVLDQLLGASW